MLTLGDQKEVLLNDGVLVELQAMRKKNYTDSPKDHIGTPTDQDDVLGALLFVLQLTDIKVRVIRGFERIRALLVLVVGGGQREVRGRQGRLL